MLYFLKEFTEPIAYLIYCIVLLAINTSGKKQAYKLLCWFYAIASLLLVSASIQNDIDVDNDWNYNLLFLLAICMYSYYYHSLCRSVFKKRFIVNCCVANILLFAYYNIIKAQFFNNYNNYVYALVFISIVVYSFLYYQELLMNVNEENILLKFDFWLVSANLFYFLGAFVVILFYTYADLGSRGKIWSIQSVILFISALIALNGYFVIASRKKS